MNKIYQVIWSKVKHCYVVTSELAKRHGKRGNGREVRGMRMGVGGVRRGALALGVAFRLDRSGYERGTCFCRCCRRQRNYY